MYRRNQNWALGKHGTSRILEESPTPSLSKRARTEPNTKIAVRTWLYFKIGTNKNKKYKTEVLSGAPVISWNWKSCAVWSGRLQRPERGKRIIISGLTGMQGEDGLKGLHYHASWESPSALVLQWPLHKIILSPFSFYDSFSHSPHPHEYATPKPHS